jgi:Tfp pilus assembly protein PilX
LKAGGTIRADRTEKGIALLISIFILLLISVVAIALIVASGTESSLAGNYRSATSVYYAALAGLEEARGRLVAKNPNSFQNTASGFMPSPLPLGNPVYIINPAGGETVAPWDQSSKYADTEYGTEFGGANPPNPSPSANSVSGVGGVQGPLYKWVRINAISEQSLNLDVVPLDTFKDASPAIFYDGAQFNTSNSGSQVLEITSFAILPNGSQKLLQYLVAPVPLTFNAALTLDGNGVQFTAPTSSNFWVKGIDQGSAGSCNPAPSSVVPAVGYTNASDSSQSNILSAIPSGPPPTGNPDLRSHYTNGNPPTPSVSQVTLAPDLTTVAGLNALVQSITQSADVIISGPATQANLPAGMSATNPMTTVINGDLTISGSNPTGYGLLLVTGKFTYDPDASWNGIILVIGKGWMYSNKGNSTTTQIQGAVLLARTVDASGNPLPQSSPPIFTPAPGSPSGFDFYNTPSSLANGIYYSTCWIQASMPSLGYKILSFHEISQ